jgi:U4/U6.U5 tri-snRNP-associated protein 1
MLENALVVEERARRKARAAATKTAKPLWEEDGKVRWRRE